MNPVRILRVPDFQSGYAVHRLRLEDTKAFGVQFGEPYVETIRLSTKVVVNNQRWRFAYLPAENTVLLSFFGDVEMKPEPDNDEKSIVELVQEIWGDENVIVVVDEPPPPGTTQ